MKKDKFEIQDNQYIKPYHHLLDLKKYKFFDVISWGLEYYSYVSFVIEYFEKILKNKNIKNVAEVGCGDGKILLELAMRYEDILFEGFDLSKRAVLFANAFSYGFDNLKFFDHDFKNSKKKYDVILCIETLEHIPDDEINDFLKTINNNLKNDGILLLTVPTTNLKLHPKHYRHYNINLLKNFREISFFGNRIKRFPETIKELAPTLKKINVSSNILGTYPMEKFILKKWLPDTEIIY